MHPPQRCADGRRDIAANTDDGLEDRTSKRFVCLNQNLLDQKVQLLTDALREYVGVKTISLSGSISVFAASRLGYTGWRTFCYVYKILTTSVAHTQNVKNQIWHERKKCNHMRMNALLMHWTNSEQWNKPLPSLLCSDLLKGVCVDREIFV